MPPIVAPMPPPQPLMSRVRPAARQASSTPSASCTSAVMKCSGVTSGKYLSTDRVWNRSSSTPSTSASWKKRPPWKRGTAVGSPTPTNAPPPRTQARMVSSSLGSRQASPPENAVSTGPPLMITSMSGSTPWSSTSSKLMNRTLTRMPESASRMP